jgi:lipoic acid synthetase
VGRPIEADEGERLALAAEGLGLRCVVLTSVDRDDLADRGAGHFARCVEALHSRLPGVKVEALIPDYTSAELVPLLGPPSLAPAPLVGLSSAATPDVCAHNVETVRSHQDIRDRRASFDKSLATLKALAGHKTADGGRMLTTTSLMLGLGETEAEVLETMDELREAEVDILVMGQYLQPTKAQAPVVAYITPDQFAAYGEEARKRGFGFVVSAPLARTSYHAADVWKAGGGR